MNENEFLKSNWDMLNKKAEEIYGEFGFATLNENEMKSIINDNSNLIIK